MTKRRGRPYLVAVPQPDKSVDAGDSAIRRGSPVTEEDCMLQKVIVVIALCLMLGTLTAWPLSMFQEDSVVDAIQNEKLQRTERDIIELRTTVHALDSKINWMLGGIAGIYGVLAIVGAINASILKKKV